MEKLLSVPLDWATRRSLRGIVGSAMAMLVFIVAILIGGLVGTTSENLAREQIGQSLAFDAQRIAERITHEMAARSRELNLVSNTDLVRELPTTVAPEAGGGRAPALTPALAHTQSLLNGLMAALLAYTWIAVAEPSGLVLVSTDPASVGSNINTRGSLADGLRGAGIGQIRQPVEDRRVMDLAQPIRDSNGLVVGIIAAQLAWNSLREIELATVTPDTDGIVRREAFLIGAQDAVLLGPRGTIGQTLPLDAVSRARAGIFGWSVEKWPGLPSAEENSDYLVGTGQAAGISPNQGPGVSRTHWIVLVREAQAAAFDAATKLRQRIWFAGIAIAMVFAVAGWLIAGLVTAPLARITAAAERLRQGDDVELPRLRGSAEIESLSMSLRALVAVLSRKQLALEEMEELALRDPLTGLLNRHGLRKHLKAALREARSKRTSVFVFVGDLDGFKSVNDTLGHASGDQLLCQVAARLASAVRSKDIVARIGGDEFVLAISANSATDGSAIIVARRALASIALPYKVGRHLVKVGFSLGGACWPEDLETIPAEMTPSEQFEQILQHADAALYTVKRGAKGHLLMHHGLESLGEVVS